MSGRLRSGREKPGQGGRGAGKMRVGRGRMVRRAVAIGGAAGVLAVVVYLLLLGLALVSARHDLLDGVSRLRAVQDAAHVSGGPSGLTQIYTQAESQATAAAAEFHRADDRLGPFAPFLRSLGWVPKYGGQLAASPSIAAMADETGAGLVALLRGLQPLAAGGGRRRGIAGLLPAIAAQRPAFDGACRALGQARTDRAGVTGSRLGSYASSLRTFDRVLPQLQAACRGLALLPGMLGYPRARTYLVAYENPDELRAAGGFIGSASIITIHDGRVKQDFTGTAITDENYTVPAPEPVQLYNIEPFWLFRDSNWAADFPTSAAIERYFARLDLHAATSATIDLTPSVVADVLAATGPLPIPEYGLTVTTANIAQLADYYSNWSPVPGPDNRNLPNGTGQKQFIGIVDRRLLARIERLPAPAWLRLVESLGPAVQRRDLLLNFQDSADQAFAAEIGAAGAIDATREDYLYVVDTNLSYNKINPFVHEFINARVTVRSDHWLLTDLRIRFDNRTPAAYAGQGLGPGAGRLGGKRDYADFVRVFVPDGSQLVDQSGWTQAWSPGPAYGKTMFCGYLIVRQGRMATIRLQYITPPNVFVPSNGTRFRILVQHQPGSHPDRLRLAVRGAGIPPRTWVVAHPSADVQKSEAIPFRPFSPIPLSAQPQEVAAPGHWIEPHAYLAAGRST